jgi:hypothetical protein
LEADFACYCVVANNGNTGVGGKCEHDFTNFLIQKIKTDKLPVSGLSKQYKAWDNQQNDSGF